MAGVRYIGIPDIARRIEVGAQQGEPRAHWPDLGEEDPWPGTIQEDALTDDSIEGMSALLSCISRRGGTWRVADMPSPDLVRTFVDILVRYNPVLGTRDSPRVWVVGTAPLRNDWYRLYGLPDDDAPRVPSSSWARPLGGADRVLVDLAARFIGGDIVNASALGFQITNPPTTRSLEQKLFDRLRVSFPLRNTWVDGLGVPQPLKTTFFGRIDPDNPFWKFRNNLSGEPTGNALGAVVRLTDPPDAFALPLDWRDANLDTSGAVATLDEATRDQLTDAAKQLTRDKGVEDDKNLAGSLTLVYGLTAPFGLLISALQGDAPAQALNRVRTQLETAAAADRPLGDVVYHVLAALREFDFDLKVNPFDLSPNVLELATGMSAEDLDALMVAFTSQIWIESLTALPGVEVEGNPPAPADPMILIGDRFSEMAELVGRDLPRGGWNEVPGWIPFAPGLIGESYQFWLFNAGTDAAPTWMDADQRLAAEAWQTWWNAALPTRDAAILFDAIGVLVGQVINLDDLQLAVSSIAGSDGLIASVIRNQLYTANQLGGIDPLGGVGVSELLGLIIRQVLTDTYIDWQIQMAARDGITIERECLYELFCWMDTPTKRRAADAALGPLVVTSFRGEAGPDPVWTTLRQAFLGLDADESDEFLAARRFLSRTGGAEAMTGIWTNLVNGTLQRIAPCDLGTLRDWIVLTRGPCDWPGLEQALSPRWTTSGLPRSRR